MLRVVPVVPCVLQPQSFRRPAVVPGGKESNDMCLGLLGADHEFVESVQRDCEDDSRSDANDDSSSSDDEVQEQESVLPRPAIFVWPSHASMILAWSIFWRPALYHTVVNFGNYSVIIL